MNTPQQKSFKVLLIGDSCEDEYVYGKCERISPEAPVPIMMFSKMETKSGMAGNVCLNLQAFGLDVTFLTNSENITKTRFIDEKSNQQILRVDTEKFIKPLMLPVSTHGFDALVISDYDKGYLLHSKLNEIIDSTNIPIFVDSKKTSLPSKKNCFIKINDLEYKNLLEKENHSNIIITKGSDGCIYKDKHYPAEKVNVYDVVGAGDTFISALVYGYLKTDGDIDRSITLANKAAAIAVQNNGTYILTNNDVKNICNRY
jgi:D-beta-D-heptose 7-phosphate kinase/D-beta-D-heptose 1-phosphate adenosyltransferase